VQLDDEAKELLIRYPWPGNVRELKNIAEQISVLSEDKLIAARQLRQFLPEHNTNRMPVLAGSNGSVSHAEFANEREILYKLFFDMKKDVTELKKMFVDILQNPQRANAMAAYTKESLLGDYQPVEREKSASSPPALVQPSQPVLINNNDIYDHEEVEESLNIMDKEKELIVKALKKHRGKRKDASSDLGISERTLYRKLKEYDINE
jgi:DNA-binding NtrC family response regulator